MRASPTLRLSSPNVAAELRLRRIGCPAMTPAGHNLSTMRASPTLLGPSVYRGGIPIYR
jgi:hypothetical protein